ncbi:hypothetical protein O3G_MSEX014478 [Manduca sexta]|uniref:unspecific monooxygenase n=1 Tax=Manduca sexta TaxID=7130 RepID=A0A921ZX12_MANSE|nr:hypothetical protein O3G_MSEX014478 [Manduca sexta]
MILFLLLVLGIVLYAYFTRNHSYWAKRNVKHDRPIPIFGNHLRNILGLKSLTEIATELYNKYPDEKVVGYYRGNTPELIIRDPDIVRYVLNVDFPYFYPRGLGRNNDAEPLLKNLFHADGDSWRLLRKRLTPAFTTAKLKRMFPLVVMCAKKMQTAAEGIADRGAPCDVREMMARFTTEFIAACGFGIQTDTINDENSRFREMGKLIFSRSWVSLVVVALWDIFPELRSVLKVGDSGVEEAITTIYQNIRSQRNGKPSSRNDFVDLLLELEQKGKIQGESIEKMNSDGPPVMVEMDMDTKCIVAQMFVFFAAGFETSSSATSFTLHELAFNQDVQLKIQKEIDQVLAKYNNELCYDAVAEMSLLSMAFKESLRIFPSLGNLHRVCARSYTIPGLDITIDPGVKIIIPVEGIQNDPKYYDEPKRFNPERFAGMEPSQYKYTFMAFGEGPRACIGK